MKIKQICDTVVLAGRKTVFAAKKHSPEIMIGTGIALGVGTVIMTWFAAKKTDKALEEPKKIIATAKSMEITEHYTKEDQKHDILLGYKKGAVEIAKLYGPIVIMGASSIACVLTSHKILSGRYAGVVAANGILSKEFSDYRDKVIEKYGKEEDYKFRFGDKMENVAETTKDENGSETTIVKEQPKNNYASTTFARCFDETSPAFQKDALYNIDTLKRLQGQLNDELKAKRVLTLNDAYELLGYEKTQAGFYYGWIYDPRSENKSFVDFGLPFEDREWIHRMIVENQRYYWLDFNCTEIVWSSTPFREA